jgi:hypothetical protein
MPTSAARATKVWKRCGRPRNIIFDEAPVEPVALQPDFCSRIGACPRSTRAVAAVLAARRATLSATGLLAAVAAAGLFGAAALATAVGDTGAEGEHGDAGSGDEEQVSNGVHGRFFVFVFVFGFVLRKPKPGSGEFGEVFRGILLELGEAGLAAELDLLPVADPRDDLAHRAERVVGDEAVVHRIPLCGRGRGDEEGRNGREG